MREVHAGCGGVRGGDERVARPADREREQARGDPARQRREAHRAQRQHEVGACQWIEGQSGEDEGTERERRGDQVAHSHRSERTHRPRLLFARFLGARDPGVV